MSGVTTATNGEVADEEAADGEAGGAREALTWEDSVDEKLSNLEARVTSILEMLTESTKLRRQLLGILRHGLDRACEIGKLLVDRVTDPSPRFLVLLLFLLIAAGAITAGTVTDVFGAFKGLKITLGDEAETLEALESEPLEASGVVPSNPPVSDPPDAPLDDAPLPEEVTPATPLPR